MSKLQEQQRVVSMPIETSAGSVRRAVLALLCVLGLLAATAPAGAQKLIWTPQLYLPVGSTSIASILKPAGVERAVGTITLSNQKNPLDPQWRDDAGMKDYAEFMKRWAFTLDAQDSLNVT